MAENGVSLRGRRDATSARTGATACQTGASRLPTRVARTSSVPAAPADSELMPVHYYCLCPCRTRRPPDERTPYDWLMKLRRSAGFDPDDCRVRWEQDWDGRITALVIYSPASELPPGLPIH
jgi:hypothetical protein